MKDIRKWIFLAGILILFGQITAQKPKVQVTFQLTKDTEFYKKYKSDTMRIKQEGLLILIDALEQYIPFIDFTADPASNKLEVRIGQKNAQNSTSIQESLFFISFVDSLNNMVNAEWPFLKSGALIALNPGAASALPKIQEVWLSLLKANYNNVLVFSMFKKIPINLPSKDYYLKIDDQYELVLPFKKQDINLSPDTDFMVVIQGKLKNFDKDVPQFPLRYAGDVVEGMGMLPAFNGCIRIGLNQFKLNTIKGGQVFFLSYVRQTNVALHEDL